MKLTDQKFRLFAAAGVSGMSFAAYWATHGSGPFWQDAGLFYAGLKLGGGMAPPGYPLYVIVGRWFVAIFQALMPHRTFEEAVNTFSALWAALAAGLVTLCVLLLLTPGIRFFAPPNPRPSPGKRLSRGAWAAAILAGLAAGLSYSLWYQALTAKVYSLNAFFAALILYVFLRLGAEGRLGRSPTPIQRRLTIGLFVAHGLSCANHLSTAIFVPMLAFFIWRERKALHDRRLVLSVFVAYGLSGLLPYTYLLWAAKARPTLLSSQLETWKGFFAYITGAQWTSHGESFGWAASRFNEFPVQLFHELFVVGVIALGIGAFRLFKEQRGLFGYLIVFTAAAWFLPIVYLAGGEYDFWFLPLYMALFIVAGVGCDSILRRIGASGARTLTFAGAVAAIGCAAIIPEVAINAPLVDRRSDFVAEDFALNLYRHVARNGVLFASSDQECALTYYEEYVKEWRPDVIVIDVPTLGPAWAARWLVRRYPGLKVPDSLVGAKPETQEQALEALILANVNDHVLYISKPPRMTLPPGISWTPAGGLWKLDAHAANAIDPADWDYVYRNTKPFDRPARDHAPKKPFDPVTGQPLPLSETTREPYTAQIKRFHEQAWKNFGDWYFAHEQFREAADAYGNLFALDASVDLPNVLLAMGKSLFAIDRNAEARTYLERVRGRLDDHGNAEVLLYLGQIYAGENRPDDALAAFRNARQISPELWKSYAPALREKGLIKSEDP